MMVVDVEGVVGWWLTNVSQWWGCHYHDGNGRWWLEVMHWWEKQILTSNIYIKFACAICALTILRAGPLNFLKKKKKHYKMSAECLPASAGLHRIQLYYSTMKCLPNVYQHLQVYRLYIKFLSLLMYQTLNLGITPLNWFLGPNRLDARYTHSRHLSRRS